MSCQSRFDACNCLFLLQDSMQVTVKHLAAMSSQSPVCGDIFSLSLYLMTLMVLRWPWSEVKVAQLCPTLCDPMDYTVHGILQARILEWVAVPFFRGSSQPRNRTQVSCTAGRFFTDWAMREALFFFNVSIQIILFVGKNNNTRTCYPFSIKLPLHLCKK